MVLETELRRKGKMCRNLEFIKIFFGDRFVDVLSLKKFFGRFSLSDWAPEPPFILEREETGLSQRSLLVAVPKDRS